MRLAQDVCFAARLLAKDRAHTLLAVIVLALGIGICNTAFTVLAGMFMQAIPIQGVDRLTYVDAWTTRGGRAGVSFWDFSDWARSSTAFETLAAYRLGPASVSEAGHAPEQQAWMWMTGLLRPE